MKRIPYIAILTLLFVALAVAQTKPPAISDALKAQFFKAQSQMIQAETRARQKQIEFQQAVEA